MMPISNGVSGSAKHFTCGRWANVEMPEKPHYLPSAPLNPPNRDFFLSYVGSPLLLQNLYVHRLCTLIMMMAGMSKCLQRQRSGAAKRQQRELHGCNYGAPKCKRLKRNCGKEEMESVPTKRHIKGGQHQTASGSAE